MKYSLWFLALLWLVEITILQAAELELLSPRDYQVVQRGTPSIGTYEIIGRLSEHAPKDAFLEARLIDRGTEADWKRLDARIEGRNISAMLEAPAGGWRKLEVRVSNGDTEVARATVEHVGIGEVFLIAGQSNSANHGERKLTPMTHRVVAFDGLNWQIANDPQPGASGKNGSFVPAFGDAIVEKLNVPVGIVACGIGATSVREWLPKGSRFPNPPTLVGRVEQTPDGEWISKGDAFDVLVERLKKLGPNGFRAVLWHQGESDANQKDPSRTLPGKLYREYLEKIIRESRSLAGWDVPWFVAQVSYHVPGDESSPDIRDAQASLWQDGIAWEGPDTDALKGELRERNGQGVHFSEKGLRVHGEKWAEKVLARLDEPSLAVMTVHSDFEGGNVEVVQLEPNSQRLRIMPAIREGRGWPCSENALYQVWVNARHHAWESGGSHVGRGFIEWIASDTPAAEALRKDTCVHFIPIMDVDNVVLGAGGKDAQPRDHNRDWGDEPIYPEVAAAQKMIRSIHQSRGLDVYIDLHNPGAKDPVYFFGPFGYAELQGIPRKNYQRWIELAAKNIREPVPVVPEYRFATYVTTEEERGRMSSGWVRNRMGDQGISVTLETGWNRVEMTIAGYAGIGAGLGRTLAEYVSELGK